MKSKSSDVNFGKGLATVGRVGGNISVVVAWIVLFLFAVAAIYMAWIAIEGGKMTTTNCEMDLNSKNIVNCNHDWDKETCNSHRGCKFTSDTSQLSNGARIGLGIGSIFIVLVGIIIVIFAKKANKAMHENKNLAAVGGGFFLADAIFGQRN